MHIVSLFSLQCLVSLYAYTEHDHTYICTLSLYSVSSAWYLCMHTHEHDHTYICTLSLYSVSSAQYLCMHTHEHVHTESRNSLRLDYFFVINLNLSSQWTTLGVWLSQCTLHTHSRRSSSSNSNNSCSLVIKGARMINLITDPN